MNKLSLLLICFLFLNGCDIPIDDGGPNSNLVKDKDGKIIAGELTKFSPSGRVAAVLNLKDGKLDGAARKYYEDGVTIRSELFYVKGKLEGMQKRYYKSGALYKEEIYKNGKRDGMVRKYRESGKLMSTATYKNGYPGKDLVEYLTDGRVKKKYPKLIIKEEDRLRINGTYKLRIYLSDHAKKVDYYIGELTDGTYLSNKLQKQNTVNAKGELVLSFYLQPGNYVMKEINIIAKTATRLNNSFITSRRYRIAIEYPLY